MIMSCIWGTICLSNKIITIHLLVRNTTGKTPAVIDFINKKRNCTKRRATTTNKTTRGAEGAARLREPKEPNS